MYKIYLHTICNNIKIPLKRHSNICNIFTNKNMHTSRRISFRNQQLHKELYIFCYYIYGTLIALYLSTLIRPYLNFDIQFIFPNIVLATSRAIIDIKMQFCRAVQLHRTIPSILRIRSSSKYKIKASTHVKANIVVNTILNIFLPYKYDYIGQPYTSNYFQRTTRWKIQKSTAEMLV